MAPNRRSNNSSSNSNKRHLLYVNHQLASERHTCKKWPTRMSSISTKICRWPAKAIRSNSPVVRPAISSQTSWTWDSRRHPHRQCRRHPCHRRCWQIEIVHCVTGSVAKVHCRHSITIQCSALASIPVLNAHRPTNGSHRTQRKAAHRRSSIRRHPIHRCATPKPMNMWAISVTTPERIWVRIVEMPPHWIHFAPCALPVSVSIGAIDAKRLRAVPNAIQRNETKNLNRKWRKLKMLVLWELAVVVVKVAAWVEAAEWPATTIPCNSGEFAHSYCSLNVVDWKRNHKKLNQIKTTKKRESFSQISRRMFLFLLSGTCVHKTEPERV